mgnify:CR=1 FL=1
MAEKTTILDMNRFDDSNLDGLDENKRELVRRRRILGKGYRLFYKDPVEIVRGKGSHVFDEKGNDYLDAYNNVVSVGHCHPHVVEAIAKQAATLNTHTRYLHETILDYSEALIAKMPREIDRITYQCTGSEANDLPSASHETIPAVVASSLQTRPTMATRRRSRTNRAIRGSISMREGTISNCGTRCRAHGIGEAT